MPSTDKPVKTAKDTALTAKQLATKQQEISVTEFFEKNKQILGFDSRQKSLIMGVKEAVDNSLDACEEAGYLPDIIVKVGRGEDEDEYIVYIEDNGPGIVHKMIPNVFGRLLYGSRFHALRQSRGQQGIGISATIMFGNINTGKPALVMSKTTDADGVAWRMRIAVDTKTNRPVVTGDEAFIWEGKEHGTGVEYATKGRYVTGRQSIFEYLKETAIVNPHARIEFHDPEGKVYLFERATEQLPPRSNEIKPHPEGMEIGDLMRYAADTGHKNVKAFLKNDFSRVTDRIADEILSTAGVKPTTRPDKLTREDFREIIKAIGTVRIMAPPTDCLSPIGETLIKKGLMHILDGLRPEYYATPVTRAPKTVNGNPFIIEAGIVYGGEIPSDGQVQILRFANRVPLLYQQGACVMTKAIAEVDWRRYGLEQRGGKGIPYGPAIILVHIASTKVPFTSEGKEAVASFDEIQSEVNLALRLCARNLKSHLNKMERKSKTHAKFRIVQEILPDLANKSAEMLGRPVPDLSRTISGIMNVVWIEPSVEKPAKNTRVLRYGIYNYTTQPRSVRLHAHLPKDCVNLTLFSNPYFVEMNEDGKATWEVAGLQPSTDTELVFELKGDMADTFDADDIYISGINPMMVMGAEALPGDWGIKGLEIVESEDDYVRDEPEEEIAAEEDLGDE